MVRAEDGGVSNAVAGRSREGGRPLNGCIKATDGIRWL